MTPDIHIYINNYCLTLFDSLGSLCGRDGVANGGDALHPEVCRLAFTFDTIDGGVPRNFSTRLGIVSSCRLQRLPVQLWLDPLLYVHHSCRHQVA